MSGGGGYEQGSTSTGPWKGQESYLTDIFSTGRKMSTGKNLKGEDILSGPENLKIWNPETQSYNQVSSNFKDTWLDSPLAYQYYGYTPQRSAETGALTGINKRAGQDAVAGFDPLQTEAQIKIAQRARDNPLNRQAQSSVLGIMSGEDKVDPYTMNAANINYTPNMLPWQMGDVNYAGKSELSNTAEGDYLKGNANPYLDPMFEGASRQLNRNFNRNIIPSIDSSAELSGRYGSDVWRNMRGDANADYLNSIEDLAASMYGGAYESERGRMMDAQQLGAGLASDVAKTNALLGQESGALNTQLGLQKGLAEAGFRQEANKFNPEMMYRAQSENLGNVMNMAQFAPNLALQDYEDYARMAAVGEERRAMDQANRDQMIRAWEFYNQEPIMRLGNYSNLVSGSYGGTTNSSAESGK